MKKILTTSAVIMGLLSTQSYALELKQYVSSKLNYSSSRMDINHYDTDLGYIDFADDFKDGVFGASLAYGVYLNNVVRLELEGNLAQQAKDSNDYIYELMNVKTKLKSNSLLLNLYYEIPTSNVKVHPYMGAGIGASRLEVKSNVCFMNECDSDSGKKTRFSWQFGLGAKYDLTDVLSLDIGYRYINNGKVTERDSDTKATTEISSHNIYVGCAYNF